MSAKNNEFRTAVAQIIKLHEKYLHSKYPVKLDRFVDLNTIVLASNPDVALFEALKAKVLPLHNERVEQYLESLQDYFTTNSDYTLKETPERFSDLDTDEDELGPNEETFGDKYPQVDEDSILFEVYTNWLGSVKAKPFYKTIKMFYDRSLGNSLNFVDRDFLWAFIKAISSCITHLIIEGEQKEEALALVDKYYDSLVHCMNTVVHAGDKGDVITAFQYMVDFLGMIPQVKDNDDGEE